MSMWCSRLVNRSLGSRAAASRSRIKPGRVCPMLCVMGTHPSFSAFSLSRPFAPRTPPSEASTIAFSDSAHCSFGSSLLWPCPTSRPRGRPGFVFFPGPGQRSEWAVDQRRDLPSSAQETSMHASGLTTPERRAVARVSASARVAFPFTQQGRHARSRFRSSILSLRFPLSTLNPCPCGQRPMTRGPGGSLLLSGWRAFTSNLLPIYLGALGVLFS